MVRVLNIKGKMNEESLDLLYCHNLDFVLREEWRGVSERLSTNSLDSLPNKGVFTDTVRVLYKTFV